MTDQKLAAPARCGGQCGTQTFESQELTVTDHKELSIEVIPLRDEENLELLQESVDAAIEDRSFGCECESCQCVLFEDQDPPWTPWVEVPVAAETSTTHDGKVSHVISGTVEIRSRFLEGLCIPTKIEPYRPRKADDG